MLLCRESKGTCSSALLQSNSKLAKIRESIGNQEPAKTRFLINLTAKSLQIERKFLGIVYIWRPSVSEGPFCFGAWNWNFCAFLVDPAQLQDSECSCITRDYTIYAVCQSKDNFDKRSQ